MSLTFPNQVRRLHHGNPLIPKRLLSPLVLLLIRCSLREDGWDILSTLSDSYRWIENSNIRQRSRTHSVKLDPSSAACFNASSAARSLYLAFSSSFRAFQPSAVRRCKCPTCFFESSPAWTRLVVAALLSESKCSFWNSRLPVSFESPTRNAGSSGFVGGTFFFLLFVHFWASFFR